MIKILENNTLSLGLIEKYANKNSNKFIQILSVLVCIISFTLWVYALIKAIQCLKNGVGQLCDLMAACCIPHLYILYRLARPCKPKNL